jgi:hypothetical protein
MRPFGEFEALPMQAKPLASDFVLPVFEEPLQEPWPLRMSWLEAVRRFARARAHYMRHFDSPEKRLRNKNPEPFVLP